jgi:putative ABC transport system permease protein
MKASLLRDIGYAIRILRRSPGFAVLAVLTLALGIGANTAIFSVFDAVLLRPLPVRDPQRLVVIHDQLPALNLPRTEISATQYLECSRRTDLFEDTSALTTQSFNLMGQGTPQRLIALRVSASFFPLLGLHAQLGRFFTPEEDHYGGAQVVLLSDSLWRSTFGSNPGVLGKSLQLNGASYNVIGVLPAAMQVLYPHTDIVVPAAFTPAELSQDRAWSLAWTTLARLKSGVNVAQAQAGIATTVAHLAEGADLSGFGMEVRPLLDERVGDVREPLWMLLGAVVLVLLIACVNIANLLLARAGTRAREIAIRAAMGASRIRIVLQLLTESVLLAAAGGLLGLLFAEWGIRGLEALAPRDLLRSGAIELNWAVLAFTLGISVLAGALFGLAPALQSTRADLNEALKESGRTGAGGIRRQALRRVLVVSEVALALILVACSGLLLRSFAKLLEVNPGFNTRNLLTMRLSLPQNKYSDRVRVTEFGEDLVRRVAAMPGVLHAAMAFEPPFIGGDNSVFSMRDYTPGPGRPVPHADYILVSPDYLATMQIPLVRGRWFTLEDFAAGAKPGTAGTGAAVVIDEALAKRFWPDRDPIGGGISWSDKGPWSTVVGVVGSVRRSELTEESKGAFYMARYFGITTLIARTSGNPDALANAIRAQVSNVDPDQPVYDIQTMEQRISQSLERRRFATVLLGVFAGLAFLLALIGLQGVIAYIVTQRTHEIGIRMALGAQRSDVLRDVLWQGMALAIVGVVIGLIGAGLASRVIADQLFGIQPLDWRTYLGASVVLIAAAILASYIPAKRATKVDPMIALRYE